MVQRTCTTCKGKKGELASSPDFDGEYPWYGCKPCEGRGYIEDGLCWRCEEFPGDNKWRGYLDYGDKNVKSHYDDRFCDVCILKMDIALHDRLAAALPDLQKKLVKAEHVQKLERELAEAKQTLERLKAEVKAK